MLQEDIMGSLEAYTRYCYGRLSRRRAGECLCGFMRDIRPDLRRIVQQNYHGNSILHDSRSTYGQRERVLDYLIKRKIL
jgi:hypothetical protein